MNYVNTVLGFVRREQDIVLISAAALTLILLIAVLVLTRKVAALTRMAVGVVDGETGRYLRDELVECEKKLSAVSDQLDASRRQLVQLKEQQEQCLQRIGFIRFDAFDGVGGEQSFAVALLDAKNSGVVMSNLFSRVDSRVYAKRLSGGTSEQTLSSEEQEAIRKAVPL
jgi:signal transduction histidine kinase